MPPSMIKSHTSVHCTARSARTGASRSSTGTSELPVGPPPDHKLAREQVVEEMRAAGWSVAQELGLLPYQYVLVFRWRQDSK